MKITCTAANPTEQRILDYLQQNASELLAQKINAGKKTLSGAVKYATAEARKLANGSGCVCVDDATVFGWIIHFFEEDDVKEPAKEKTKAAVVKKAGAPAEPVPKKKPATQRPAPPAKPPSGPIFLELFSMDEIRGAKK